MKAGQLNLLTQTMEQQFIVSSCSVKMFILLLAGGGGGGGGVGGGFRKLAPMYKTLPSREDCNYYNRYLGNTTIEE